MTFFAPALGALGAAAALPVVLHLLQRHQGPRLVFPALRYLQRAEREHATRIRLRQVLLLALRVVAILLIAAAAARPFLPLGGSAHEPMAVAVVLDNSLSSGAVLDDRRVLDALRDRAMESVAAAGPDDRLWLVLAGEPWAAARTGDAATLLAALRSAGPSDARADLGAAVRRAAAILESGADGRPREIQLVSDLQASALPVGGPGAPSPLDAGGASLRILRPALDPPPNRGVSRVLVGGGVPPRAGRPSQVAATVTGSATPDSVGVRLVLDGRVVGAARVRAGVAALLPFPARGPGLAAGRVEIDADALTADDRGYFATVVRPAPAVATTRSQPFVEEALSVLEDEGRIRRTEPRGADVVLAPGGAGIGGVPAAAAVVVPGPAAAVERTAANRRLAEAGIGWRFGDPARGEGRFPAAAAQFAPGDDLRRALASVRLRSPLPLEPVDGGGDTTLLRLETGERWAVAGTGADGRRFVLLGSPLTAEGGTLPTSAAMVPLLETAVTAWAAGDAASATYEPGDRVDLAGADSIQTPDGRTEALDDADSYRLTRAGIYRATRHGRLMALLAVDPPAAESGLTPATTTQLRSAFAGADVRIASPRSWRSAIFHRRLGREVTLPLLAAALLLLLVESAVAAGGGGRHPAGPAHGRPGPVGATGPAAGPDPRGRPHGAAR